MDAVIATAAWSAVAVFALVLVDRQVTRIFQPRSTLLTDEQVKKEIAEVREMARKALSSSTAANLALGVRADERPRKG